MMMRSHLSRAAGGRRRQPWYVGSNGATDGTQTFQIDALSGGYWSAAAEGDVVVVAAACANAAQNPTISTAGYTTLADMTQGILRLIVAYKVMGATPDTQVTVANTDRETTRAWVFKGISSSAPIDATTTTAQASSTAMDSPAITTTNNAAIVLAIGAAFTAGALSPSNPPGMAALGSSTSSWIESITNYRVHVDASMISNGLAGAYNPAAWGDTAAVTHWCTATVALRPA